MKQHNISQAKDRVLAAITCLDTNQNAIMQQAVLCLLAAAEKNLEQYVDDQSILYAFQVITDVKSNISNVLNQVDIVDFEEEAQKLNAIADVLVEEAGRSA